MELTLHHLRLLREVAALGTISAAADRLGYTSSAVSQQLAGLERACGVAVLERVGRNVRLTDAGRELVRRAHGLLAEAEEALVAVERVGASVAGVVEATVYESVASGLLPGLLRELRQRHPELELRTRQVADVAIEELIHGTTDLAFAIDYPTVPEPVVTGVERWTIIDDQFHLVVPETDPLPSGPVDLRELADRSFICSPPDVICGRFVHAVCRAAGFEPLVPHALDDYATALKLVAAGEGVALIPDLGLLNPVPGIRILELREPLSRSIQLAVRTASAERPALVAIRDAVEHVANALSLQPARAA